MSTFAQCTLRAAAIALCLSIASRAPTLRAQQASPLPEAPSTLLSMAPSSDSPTLVAEASSEPTLNLDPMAALAAASSLDSDDQQSSTSQQPSTSQTTVSTPQDTPKRKRSSLLGDATDANGNPIPLEKQQPKRILGFMPNFRSVSAGAAPHPPGWKYNFTVATRQAFDYSSFVFLGLTTISAEGLNEHPVLGKGVHGFYSYGWRGFLDKTDGTYLGAWLLPSLLHEDTRFYAKGRGHSVVYRALYVMSRQVVTRTYGGHDTPNFAGLGGKVLTQIVSRTYYPTGATSFGVLAEKFGYASMRDISFTAIREFYPDIAAYYIHKHDRKVAAMAAHDAAASGVTK